MTEVLPHHSSHQAQEASVDRRPAPCRRNTPTLSLASVCASLLAIVSLCIPVAAIGNVRMVEGHMLPGADEYPRLIVRGEAEVNAVRSAAETDWGKRIVRRMEQAQRLMDALPLTGRNRDVVKEAGFKSAGNGALYLLTDDRSHVNKAREAVLVEIVGYPMVAQLDLVDRASRLHGTAVAFDLCNQSWSRDARERVRKFLIEEAQAIRKAADSARRSQPDHVMAYAAAGMAEMVLLNGSDDGELLDRIRRSERVIVNFMDSIGDGGFSPHGEAVRQAAMASGVLPYVRASKLVLGRDLSQHPAIKHAITPMLYLTVPGAGIPMIGPFTPALDRGGIFAAAAAWLDEPMLNHARWLMDRLDGDRFLGIVRPHEGLEMLRNGLIDRSSPNSPYETLPNLVHSAKANMTVVRSGWDGPDDVVLAVHNAGIRILGLGGYFAGHAGPHAGAWSHAPGAGRQDNVFSIHTTLGRDRMYDLRSDWTMGSFTWDDDSETASGQFTVSGRLNRTTESIRRTERDEENRRVTREIPVAEGGEFTGSRTIGVDYSGKSGAPAVFVFSDRLEGVAGAPRAWIMHLGGDVRFDSDGGKFTARIGDATLVGTVVAPADIEIRSTTNAPHANFITIDTEAEQIEIIMTLQRGSVPRVTATDKGLAGGVRVGDQSVKLENGRIVFGQ
ncbi:MAG: hypothetical protein JJU36_04035 [Phycisphaeraceae bacterium]|nr:hypothetical protein [Phycisphaeraceae bacterium]